MRKYRLFLFFILTTSCISHRYIDIQVLNPSSKRLPHGTIVHFILPEKCAVDTASVAYDSSCVYRDYEYKVFESMANALKKNFNESPFFEKSQFIIQTEKSYVNELDSLSSDNQKKTYRMMVNNFIIKNYIPRVKLDIDDDEFSDLKVYNEYRYRLLIQLKNIGTNNLFDNYLDRDTLRFCIINFPKTNEALTEIGNFIGEKYAKRIAPVWETEERFLYYSVNKYMRHGYKKLVKDDLEGAISEWMHLYNVGTHQLASIAAHNIALVYEMQDDLENCKTWLTNSLSKRKHPFTKEYLEYILKRISLRENAEKQIIL